MHDVASIPRIRPAHLFGIGPESGRKQLFGGMLVYVIDGNLRKLSQQAGAGIVRGGVRCLT
jgi:hypothetical protein